MAVNIGELTGRLTLEDAFTSRLKAASGQLDAFSANFKRMGQATRDAGMALSAAITLPIAGLAAGALQAGLSFEGAMNRVEAAVQPSAAEMEKLRKAAQDMGAATVFSSTEAAQALVELGKAGLSSADSIKALPSVLQLAVAGQMDMNDAAMLTTNTMKTFGLATEDMAHANDVLAKAANSSTIDVRDLAESFKYVGPVAKMAGVSLEMVSAAAALLGEAGIKGSMAGTTLRNTLTTLMSPTDKQASLMKELGLQSAYANGKLMELPQVIEILAKQTGKGAQILELFGDRAGPGLVALVDKGAEALRKLDRSLQDSNGYAQRAADTMMKGLPGAMERMKGSIDTAFTALNKTLEPVFVTIINGVERLANFITNEVVPAFDALPGPVKLATVALVAVGAAVGPVLVLVGTLVTGLASLAAAPGMGAVIAAAPKAIAAIKGIGLAALSSTTLVTAFTVALGAFVVPFALIKIYDLIVQIKGLLSDQASWKIDALGRAATDAKAMAEASKLAGRDVKDLGEALGILKAHGAALRGETVKGNAVTIEQARIYAETRKGSVDLMNSVVNLHGKVGQATAASTAAVAPFAAALKAAEKEITGLSKTVRADLIAAIRSGVFSMDDLKAVSGLTERALALLTERVREGDAASEKAAAAAVRFKDRLADIKGEYIHLIPAHDRWKAALDELPRTLDGSIPLINNFTRAWPTKIPFLVNMLDDIPRLGAVTVTATKTAADHIGLMSRALSDLATVAKGAFGSVVSGLSQMVSGIGVIEKAFASLSGEKGKIALAFGSPAEFMNTVSGLLSIAAAGAQIGKALQPLLGLRHGKLGALLGTNADGRAMVNDFAESLGGYQELHDKLSAIEGGESLWVMLTQKVGRSNVKEAQAAIDKVTEALAKQEAAQNAVAAAAGATAEAQVEAASAAQTAIDAMTGEINGLLKSIEDEAPEEVMGVVEAATRARIAAIEAERNAAQQAIDATVAAAATAAEEAGNIIDAALAERLFIIRVRGELDLPGQGGRPDGSSDSGFWAGTSGSSADTVVGGAAAAGVSDQTIVVPVSVDGEVLARAVVRVAKRQ